MTKFNSTESSDQILFVSMLQILNLKYFIHFFIVKYIGIESVIFAINLNITSSSKVFITFNFVCSIDCIANPNQWYH